MASYIIFGFRSELLQKVHYFIHLNLAIVLFLAYVMFIAGIKTAKENQVSKCVGKMCMCSIYTSTRVRINYLVIILIASDSVKHKIFKHSLFSGCVYICVSVAALFLPLLFLLDAV